MENRWFKKIKGSNAAKMRLFAFHHAGGSADSFRSWDKFLPEWLELYALQSPGRGNRFIEEPITDMGLLMGHAVPNIVDLLDLPYIFLGHSLGGSVAFELAREIGKLKYALPEHLFVLGREGPKVPPDIVKHDLPETEMIRYLKMQDGTHDSIFDNEELLKLLLSIIRADLELSEKYCKYFKDGEPIACPIHAFWADGEHELNDNKINEWQKETAGEFTVDKFSGSHFFLHESTELVVAKMLEYINQKI